jgi:hypothetical protein
MPRQLRGGGFYLHIVHLPPTLGYGTIQASLLSSIISYHIMFLASSNTLTQSPCVLSAQTLRHPTQLQDIEGILPPYFNFRKFPSWAPDFTQGVRQSHMQDCLPHFPLRHPTSVEYASETTISFVYSPTALPSRPLLSGNFYCNPYLLNPMGSNWNLNNCLHHRLPTTSPI